MAKAFRPTRADPMPQDLHQAGWIVLLKPVSPRWLRQKPKCLERSWSANAIAFRRIFALGLAGNALSRSQMSRQDFPSLDLAGRMRKTLDLALRHFWRDLKQYCLDDERMYRFIGGDLSPGESAEIEDHLGICEICALKHRTVLETANLAAEDTELQAAPKIELMDRFFALARTSSDKLSQFFSRNFFLPGTLELFALKPLALQRAMADTGGGFEKQIKASDDSPFDLEFSTFGKRLRIVAKSKAPLYDNCVLRFRLLEGKKARYAGTMMVIAGKGQYEVDIDDVPKPERDNLTLSVQPVTTLDLLSKFQEEASVEVLARLLHEKEADVRQSAARLLAAIPLPRAREVLKAAADDPDPEVRETVRPFLIGK